MKRLVLSLVLAALIPIGVAPANASVATPSGSETASPALSSAPITLDSASPDGAFQSTLVITPDQPITPEQRFEIMQLGREGSVTAAAPASPAAMVRQQPLSGPIGSHTPVPMAPAPDPGPQYHPVFCNNMYAWADEKGSFSYQKRCGVNAAPWGFKMLPWLRRAAVSPVTETGLIWYNNGVKVQKNSPHSNVPADYHFHGTMNPIKPGWYVRYSDDLTFRIAVNGGTGTARLHVFGNLSIRS